MDFTCELSSFQGVIVSLDNEYNFSRLASRGGNEERIKHVVNTLEQFLKNENYINDQGVIETMLSKTRKFALYLILNGDFKILETMVELEGIFLVIWSIPTLPKHLLCDLMWTLHMEDFVCEIITYCYPPLSTQVAEAFTDHIKYFHPSKCLKKLHKLGAALYSFLCRLHCFEFEDFNNLLTTTFETFGKCLKYFINPPNSFKLNALSKDDCYKFKGECLKTMLILISECFNHFTQEINSSCFSDIYKSTYKEGCYKINPPTNIVCEGPNDKVRECLDNCNTLMLDIFKEIVMEVSVDIFCAWSEFETNGKSMQQTIGELCHKVQTKLSSVSSVSEHPVIGMIQQMARKPVQIKDIINSVDTNVIIQNININNEEKASWIHALVDKEELCQHIDLINVIDSNIAIFDEKECLNLYQSFTNYAKSNTNNRDLVISISIKVFQYCSVEVKHKLLKEHFLDNQLVDIKDDEEFQNTLTEMFNKFVASSDMDFTKVLNIFLQNPRHVYHKIFILATENAQLANTMLQIMHVLKDYSDYYYVTETEPCIIKTIKNALDSSLENQMQQENIVRFICGLKNNEIIPGTKLLLLIIMPNMHKALQFKEIPRIHIQIQLLGEAYTINELLKYRAPMLAMLSQTLEVVRWRNLRCFIPNASLTLQLTLEFQKSLIDTYDNIIPEAEGHWLRVRLKQMNMQPQNNYYYRKLWSGPETSFFQSVSGMVVDSSSSRSEISVWVTQILTSGTQEEWCIVWDDLSAHIEDIDVLCIFHETLRMITKAVEATRTPATKACLLYCIQNLVYVIRYKFIQELLTDRQVISAVFSLSKLLKETNVEDVEEIGLRLMPLFAYLVEKKSHYTVPVPSYFKNTNYSTMVCRAFSGTNG